MYKTAKGQKYLHPACFMSIAIYYYFLFNFGKS